MSILDFLEQYPGLKSYLIPMGIGALGLVLVIIGILTSLNSSSHEQISFQNNQDVGNGFKPFPTVITKQIIVDIEGAVIKAGVYHLAADSRLQDALIASGGLSENADRTFVEKQMNLAGKLVDGAKVYIPKIGETPAVGIGFMPILNQSDSVNSNQSTTINVNDATVDQLNSLPGIGQVTAQKIISGRPYSDTQELVTKKIVSSKVFAKIKDVISIN